MSLRNYPVDFHLPILSWFWMWLFISNSYLYHHSTVVIPPNKMTNALLLSSWIVLNMKRNVLAHQLSRP